ncbi:hypothetical protein [Robiginitalea aurantiaca]|uniref:Uncharacterized protein n=1 Tax=Robiginitalea aurantiaca TaxID=3056915 RepID=A0ABT7WCF3_9FLAO|nr:hypothetical protein [Robiginitalea aurantiaca]MDM9630586.1 hypothetical protein [Robiginitalea aurantiaca]
MESNSGRSGFKVPKGYFEHLPDQIARRAGERLNSPGPAKTGFQTPEDYFETFGDRLEKRLQKKETPVRSLKWAKHFWIPAAAAAILLLLLWSPSSPAAAPEFGDINVEVLEAYLQTEEFELTPSELAENISLSDLAMEDVLDSAPAAQQIEEYLENNIESDEELYWEPNE